MNEVWTDWLIQCDWEQNRTGLDANVLSAGDPSAAATARDSSTRFGSASRRRAMFLPFRGLLDYHCTCFRASGTVINLHCNVWMRTGRERFVRSSKTHSATRTRIY